MFNKLKVEAVISLVIITFTFLAMLPNLSSAQGGANLSLPFARRSLVTGTFGGGHDGIDYRASNGTPVVAARTGTVVALRDWVEDGTYGPGGWGNYIKIDHGGGYKTIYAHLSRNGFNVTLNQYVHRGQRIANSDDSGNSTAPHLHFELQHNGTPVDPYDAAWISRSPIPMGYRDQDGDVHGPYALDRTKIHNMWFALNGEPGAPEENDWTSSCVPQGSSTQATLYIQGFERGYIQYCGSSSAEYIAYDKTYLPDARIDDDDWTSSVTARNDGSSANVTIFFRAADGKVVDSRKYYNLLSANAAWTLDGADLSSDWKNPVTDFSGSAEVVASQDVSVVVEQERYRNGRYSFVSTLGMPANQTADTLHLPVVMRNYYGWETAFRVQNSATQATWVRATYYAQSGAQVHTVDKYVQANGNVEFNQAASDHSALGSGFNGSAVVTALTSGTPLAVHLYETHQTDPDLFSYGGFSSGSQTLYLPILHSNAYGGSWSTSFSLKNVASGTANVSLEFINEDGSTHCTDIRSISASFSAWLPQYPGSSCAFPNGWVGSARITSNRDLAGIVNQINSATGSDLAATYSALGGGSTTVVLPYLPRNVSGWSSSFTLQNLGNAQTEVTYTYYRADGSVKKANNTVTLAAGASASWYLPDVSGLSNEMYTVVATSDGQPIGAIVNTIGSGTGDRFTSYNGRNY